MNNMANFKQDILDAVCGEPIEAIRVLGPLDRWGWPNDVDVRDKITEHMIDVSLPAETILPLLDYEYDDGYGGQDCHDILVWTAYYVYYVHEYDGSTSIYSVKRNP